MIPSHDQQQQQQEYQKQGKNHPLTQTSCHSISPSSTTSSSSSGIVLDGVATTAFTPLLFGNNNRMSNTSSNDCNGNPNDTMSTTSCSANMSNHLNNINKSNLMMREETRKGRRNESHGKNNKLTRTASLDNNNSDSNRSRHRVLPHQTSLSSTAGVSITSPSLMTHSPHLMSLSSPSSSSLHLLPSNGNSNNSPRVLSFPPAKRGSPTSGNNIVNNSLLRNTRRDRHLHHQQQRHEKVRGASCFLQEEDQDFQQHIFQQEEEDDEEVEEASSTPVYETIDPLSSLYDDFDPEEEEQSQEMIPNGYQLHPLLQRRLNKKGQQIRGNHRNSPSSSRNIRQNCDLDLVEGTAASTSSGIITASSSSTALLLPSSLYDLHQHHFDQNRQNQRYSLGYRVNQESEAGSHRRQELHSSPEDNNEYEEDDDDDEDNNIAHHRQLRFSAGRTSEGNEEHHLDSVDEEDENKMNIMASESTSFLDTHRLDKDKIEESLSLPGYLCIVIAFILFVTDSGSDLLLVYHLHLKKSSFFEASLVIFVFSLVLVNVFSLKWYLKDKKDGIYGNYNCISRTSKGSKKCSSRWKNPRVCIKIMLHVLLLGPILRYFNLLKYGILIRKETRRRHKMKQLGRECRLSTLTPISFSGSSLPFSDPAITPYGLPHHLIDLQSREESDESYVKFVHEDRDTVFLMLIRSFLGCIPQLSLQTFIWMKEASSTAAAIKSKASSHSMSPMMTKTTTIIPSQQFLSGYPASVVSSSVTSYKSSNEEIFDVIRGICILTSLLHLSWSLSFYSRSMRRLIPGKKNQTTMGSMLIFAWRFFIIASRVFAIVLFTSRFGYWMIPIAIAHWGIMTVWIMHQGTNFCSQTSVSSSSRRSIQHNSHDKPCQEYLFNMIIGIVYLICFIPVKDEPNRWKYIFFYTITFAENFVFTLSWFCSFNHNLMSHSLLRHHHHLHQQQLPWFAYPSLVFVFGSFFLGIFFEILYYRYFHPNGKPLLVNRAARCC